MGCHSAKICPLGGLRRGTKTYRLGSNRAMYSQAQTFGPDT
jgi:hypothetical protein